MLSLKSGYTTYLMHYLYGPIPTGRSSNTCILVARNIHLPNTSVVMDLRKKHNYLRKLIWT